MKVKCQLTAGLSIKPDGVHEMEPHRFSLREIHRNVTVIIMRCIDCGATEVVWEKQDDTESEFFGKPIVDAGIEALSDCVYQTEHIYQNATVEVLACDNCGHVSVAWSWQPDTEELELGDDD